VTELPGSLTYNETLVLSAISLGCRYGLQIIERTGLSSGTIYPALRRLEAFELVEGFWEDENVAHADGRPARRNYVLTSIGHRELLAAKERLHSRQAALGWVR
jgi:PadR family transcriptional regulator PadR